jgi:hypothetical protein
MLFKIINILIISAIGGSFGFIVSKIRHLEKLEEKEYPFYKLPSWFKERKL